MSEEFDHHELEPIPPPQEGLPPIEIAIKVPAGADPSPLQLELVQKVREHFPTLWADMLAELQSSWGEEHGTTDGFEFVGIMIPPWEGDGSMDYERDESTVPAIENYYWEMFLRLSEAGEGLASFEGVKIQSVDLHM